MLEKTKYLELILLDVTLTIYKSQCTQNSLSLSSRKVPFYYHGFEPVL